MTNYEIATKDGFTVLGLGTTLSGDYQQLPAQKQAFWQQVTTTPRYQALKASAKNAWEFAVNEAIDGVMYFYAGVQTATDVQPAADTERAIQFPTSSYLIVKGTADTAINLFGQLEGAAFGQILPSLTDQAYVGGPNATVITTSTPEQVTGELWIPITNK
ncbi:effector binding domain-containing protein [Lactiplantibacillus daowaiensis]|uniref:Effector binding domain-containing protein n=1 Tax=Lactiplantibacillus daowaiensis TaxID=2559918 RepID=A0ABW1S1E1_9LACO|nr:effector binding domain-containing protein [Lactiplantibacillus daowaiensis]